MPVFSQRMDYLCKMGGMTLGSQEITRGSGILLAVSSLPSPFGIGTLGEAAFRFVELLADLKQKYWQVLSLGPTGVNDRPYQTMSAFAGNPYLIDLETLAKEGLLTLEEIRGYHWGSDDSRVDCAAMARNRLCVLHRAFARFNQDDPGFVRFCEQNQDWLDDYTLFMALKEQHENACWQSWPEEIRKKQPVALAKCRETLYNSIRFWGFCQYKFFEQWANLRAYANSRGIQMIGDAAFYMGEDSADVWAHSGQYLLDGDGYPVCVTASAPDRFSQTGRVWGNPLYNWAVMEQDGFAWWKRRMQFSSEMFDVIRIDHFNGFVKSYTVPRGQADAAGGKWLKGPGRKLVDALNTVIGDKCVIADDCGGKMQVPGAQKLFGRSGWLGTKVLMFAFDGDTANGHLPHNYTDCHEAVYAGTQDDDTIVGYFRDKTEYELAYLYEYLNIDGPEEISDALIRCAYASTADIAIVRMQDILKLGSETRMNAHMAAGAGWRWRMNREQLDDRRRAWIRNLAAVYRR